MLYDNFAMITKRELLIRIVKLLIENNFVNGVKHIPIEMRPRTNKAVHCCVHKDRYVLKHKIISILGFDATSDEEIYLVSLTEYAQRALDNKNVKERILSVVYEACSACIGAQHFVTNMCRGCGARPCMMNCPKGAISFKSGKATIEQDDCISCGLCVKLCPYRAIVHIPVPCEDVCPVKAISKQDDGIEYIDKDKCIYCGKCMQACPYGAIMERCKVIDIHKSLVNPNKKTIAIPAPSIFGQFDVAPGKILAAIKKIGFDEVMEVALGAEETSSREATEFKERMHADEPFMTTSCCPAYVAWVDKHASTLKPFVSETLSPMVYTARKAKELYPDADVIFIGPCLAKRYEAEHFPEIDYIMSFEELGAFIEAYEIDLANCEDVQLDSDITAFSRGYAQAGGVRNAIVNAIGENYNTASIEGLDKKSLKTLKGMVKKPIAQFVEVMACEGGCINGPCSLAPFSQAKRQIRKALN